MDPINSKYKIGSRCQRFFQGTQGFLMARRNCFAEQKKGGCAEIVIERVSAIERQRDVFWRRGPEIAQNAPKISYDTAAIDHGPQEPAGAVMAQHIPQQEEAQVSLHNGVEQIDIDRQHCVEEGTDRGGKDQDEEEQEQLPARAGVCDPF